MTATHTPSNPTANPIIEGQCHCGDVQWRFTVPVQLATACNCTFCRRYGALWVYDFEGTGVSPGTGVSISGNTEVYAHGRSIDFLFCARCHCLAAWRAHEGAPLRMAVNVRLAKPDAVTHLQIEHFDGLETFTDLPLDGRCVRDYWI
jgi:hypothetical protein